MNGLYITLIVLLVLVVLGQIRIGAQVEYCEDGLFVRMRAGAFLIPVFPVKKEKAKAKKAEKNKPPKEKKKKGGMLKLVLDFLPLVLETVGKFRRKLRVDRLEMELIICDPDPADAAIRYGQANALLGSLWQPVTQAFHVKDGRAHVGVDFEGQTPVIYILASLSLTIAQTLGLVIVFAIKGLGILIRNRTKRDMRTNQGEVVSHGEQASY